MNPGVSATSTPHKLLLRALVPDSSISPTSLRDTEQLAVKNLFSNLTLMDEINQKLSAHSAEIARITAKSRYSTKDEHDIGGLILKDVREHTLNTFTLPVLRANIDSMGMHLLQRMEEVPGKEEDKVINGPLHRLIRTLLPVGFQAKLSINKCKLVDCRA